MRNAALLLAAACLALNGSRLVADPPADKQTADRQTADRQTADKSPADTQAADTQAAVFDPFSRDNLTAWCIVPFDARKRGPDERADMLRRLAFTRYVYDWRAEHLPTFDAEVQALKRVGVTLQGVWFPHVLNADARQLLAVIEKHGLHPELWITYGSPPTDSPSNDEKVRVAAAEFKPVVAEAKRLGLKVGLYNHGGWFGEPENQMAMIEQFRKAGLDNVGLVYNLHHGHDHLDRFRELLPRMRPHLLSLNLNGMVRGGDRQGQKILPLGAGNLDRELLDIIRDSGYRGPIGILGHTDDDAELRLLDNLDGLEWLKKQLDGNDPGPRPTYRTPVARSASAATNNNGWLSEGKVEYRTPPVTVECLAQLPRFDGYNILVASDTKASGAHWELFTEAGSGRLALYAPGRTPDHVRGPNNVCDNNPRLFAVQLLTDRIRLFVDGQCVADEAVAATPRLQQAVPGPLAFGRLVEGDFGCSGPIRWVRIQRGEQALPASDGTVPTADEKTLGLWNLQTGEAVAADLSSLKNDARRTAPIAAPVATGSMPSPGPHLKPVDPSLKSIVIDRSPTAAYCGVKCDPEGRLFVGGREAVFRFDPLTDGQSPTGYGPRQEILRLPQDSIVMGLEFRGDDLYVLASSALYRVKNGRVLSSGLTPERILWGLPLDLHVSFHCLAWGPDGRLYLNHGDPLLNYGDWSTPDHTGCWTYFCGPAGKPVPYSGTGAVLSVNPDGEDLRVIATGLRGPVGLAFDADGNLFTNDNDHESQAHRYAPCKLLHVLPGVDFGWPRGWMPETFPGRMDIVGSMTPGMGRGVPCDMTYVDHPSLPEAVRKTLLLCRWDRMAVISHTLEVVGSTFKSSEQPFLEGDENARPTGVCTGRGGRVFVTCHYLPGNVVSPHCPSDLVMVLPANEHPAARITQVELPATRATRRPVTFSTHVLSQLSNPEGLRRLLEHKDTAMKIAADPHLRQVASRAYGNRLRSNPVDTLEATTPPQRLLRVLAVGHALTTADVHEIPPARLKLFYPDGNAFFHTKLRFADGKDPVDLRDYGRVGSYTAAERWRSLPRTSEQRAMVAELKDALSNEDDALALQAAYFLSLLHDPELDPAVKSTRQTVALRSVTRNTERPVARIWTLGPFSAGSSPAIETGTIDLTRQHPDGTQSRAWQVTEIANGEWPNSSSAAATVDFATFQLQAREPCQAAIGPFDPNTVRVWVNGVETPIADPKAGLCLVPLQPGSNDVLVRRETESRATAPTSVRYHAPAGVIAAVGEAVSQALLAERLKSAGSGDAVVPPEFLDVDWSTAAATGDAASGRRLFAALACNKCHGIAAGQSGTGAPSLQDARRRFTPQYVVQSVLQPSTLVAEPFRASTLSLRSGLTVSGLVVNESAEELEILLPDATRTKIRVEEVEERVASAASPMPGGLVKTPQELRDLLAYILSENPTPP